MLIATHEMGFARDGPTRSASSTRAASCSEAPASGSSRSPSSRRPSAPCAGCCQPAASRPPGASGGFPIALRGLPDDACADDGYCSQRRTAEAAIRSPGRQARAARADRGGRGARRADTARLWAVRRRDVLGSAGHAARSRRTHLWGAAPVDGTQERDARGSRCVGRARRCRSLGVDRRRVSSRVQAHAGRGSARRRRPSSVSNTRGPRLTKAQAEAVPMGLTREQLRNRLGAPSSYGIQRVNEGPDMRCWGYRGSARHPHSLHAFCFRHGRYAELVEW